MHVCAWWCACPRAHVYVETRPTLGSLRADNSVCLRQDISLESGACCLGESRGPANSSNPLQSAIVNRVQPHTAFYIGLGMELRSLWLRVNTLLAELYPQCLFCVIIIVVVVHWIRTESCYDTHLGLELLDSRVLSSVAPKWL